MLDQSGCGGAWRGLESSGRGGARRRTPTAMEHPTGWRGLRGAGQDFQCCCCDVIIGDDPRGQQAILQQSFFRLPSSHPALPRNHILSFPCCPPQGRPPLPQPSYVHPRGMQQREALAERGVEL